MEDQLKNLFVNVFSLSRENINSDTSINNVEKWSSLMHFKLVASLEEEFKIRFNEDEFLNLTSFGKILEVLKQKTV